MSIISGSTQLRGSLTLLAAAILSCGQASAGDFKYTGDTGPAYWAETAGWETCAGTHEGARQSPINIKNVRSSSRLRPLDLEIYEADIALFNNGHTIEQEHDNGSTLELNGATFELLQFHFHTFSEHTIRGRHGDMELHAVFKDQESGQLAVVGKLIVKGRKNEMLDQLIDAGLPAKDGDVTESHTSIDLSEFLGNTSDYYTYQGSLTTPNCAEIVTWLVLHRPATASGRQIRAFREIMGNNFRPIQRRNGRVIYSTRERDDD